MKKIGHTELGHSYPNASATGNKDVVEMPLQLMSSWLDDGAKIFRTRVSEFLWRNIS